LRGAEGEMPFSVKTAELTDVALVLDAGILAVTTPGDNYVEIFGAAKSIDGNRKSYDYGYGPDFQTTLPDGDYVVFARIGEGESETPITIKGGERFELTVEAAPAGKNK
jgi:Ca-activated chloride channel family protein